MGFIIFIAIVFVIVIFYIGPFLDKYEFKLFDIITKDDDERKHKQLFQVLCFGM